MAPVMDLYLSQSIDDLMKMIELPAASKSKDVKTWAICRMFFQIMENQLTLKFNA